MQGKRRRQRRKWVWGAVLVLSWGLAQPGHGQEPPPNFRSLPGLNPVQQAVAEGTDAFCDSPAGAGTDLNRSLCGGGFRGGVQSGTTDAETAKVGLQQLGYEEVAAQGTTAIEVSQTQFAHIGARLAALRGGGQRP
ncbi:MAG: hypothetical protein KatS3mg131_0931 [Candidatus Tectimicrobiota bacterium]|nr:MAG: hypothetical protein KatS3mg131_0931 [Candidatus Tectomicrobia bacterium]